MNYLTEASYLLFGLATGLIGPRIYPLGFILFFLATYFNIYTIAPIHIFVIYIFSLLYIFISKQLIQSKIKALTTFIIPAIFSFALLFLKMPTSITQSLPISEKIITIKQDHFVSENDDYLIRDDENNTAQVKKSSKAESKASENIQEKAFKASIDTLFSVFIFFVLFTFFKKPIFKNQNYSNIAFSLLTGLAIAMFTYESFTYNLSFTKAFFYLVLLNIGVIAGYNLVKSTEIGQYLYLKAYNDISAFSLVTAFLVIAISFIISFLYELKGLF